MAELLAAHFGCEIVPEFGRSYCEEHGTDTSMADLIMIAERQAMMTREAQARAKYWLVLDTDPVITAVWADMLHGYQDAWFARFDAYANLYLLLDIDLPWIGDDVRIYGDQADRERFFGLSRAELIRRGLRWSLVTGTGDERFTSALAAIAGLHA